MSKVEVEGSKESLAPGDVIWVEPEIAIGREQSGRRPALVVASSSYLEIVNSLVLVVPITTVDRGWPNHIKIRDSALDRPSWAMSEQVRSISRERIVDRAGRVSMTTLAEIRIWLADFLDL